MQKDIVPNVYKIVTQIISDNAAALIYKLKILMCCAVKHNQNSNYKSIK